VASWGRGDGARDTLGGMTASSSLPALRPYRHHLRANFLQLSTWATQRARYAFHSSRPNDCGSGDPDHARR